MADFMTINQAAESLDVNPQAVRLWIKSGRLEAYKFGSAKCIRIARQAFERFLESSKIIPKEVEG